MNEPATTMMPEPIEGTVAFLVGWVKLAIEIFGASLVTLGVGVAIARLIRTLVAGDSSDFTSPRLILANAATFLLDYTDWLSSHLEDWMVTHGGELVGKPRHYVRITPADPKQTGAAPNPDEAEIFVANGGGMHPARNIVGGDFLQLVRLGVRAEDDPLIVDSLAVIDQVIKRELPQGPGWRRYNHDGYGEKSDGSAFDGAGEGRCWPILTGERGHYELDRRFALRLISGRYPHCFNNLVARGRRGERFSGEDCRTSSNPKDIMSRRQNVELKVSIELFMCFRASHETPCDSTRSQCQYSVFA